MLRRALISAPALVLALLSGCNGAIAGEGSSSKSDAVAKNGQAGAVGGSGGATTISDTEANQRSIWPPGDMTVDVVRADNAGGGFFPSLPEGLSCAVGAARYELVLATRELIASRCTATSADRPLKLVTTKRTVTTDDLAKIDAAMKNVRRSTAEICGADKPNLELTLVDGDIENTYKDDFYSCQHDGSVYVTNLDGVFEAFEKLAP